MNHAFKHHKTLPLAQLRIHYLLCLFVLCFSTLKIYGQIEVVRVKDINSGSENGLIPNSFTDALVFNDLLFFKASDGIHGRELWISDGTSEGTYMLKDIETDLSTVSPNSFTPYNGLVFFQADDGVWGRELWVTDGTEAGTELFMDINEGNGHGSPLYFTEFDGKLYFGANDGSHGQELWVSDGTVGGTYMLKDIRTGFGGSGPNHFTEFNGELYFKADDGVHGAELWKTDGTEAGTVMVKDINESGGGEPMYFIVFNDALFFIVDDGIHGFELWKTDGTEAGTQMVKDSNPGAEGIVGGNFYAPPEPVVYNGKLYFASVNMEHLVFVLWSTDGTEAGTNKFELPDNTELWWPQDMTVFEGTLYFGAAIPDYGAELWRTDGTAAGTAMIKDINPGAGESYPRHFTPYNGNLYFTATDIDMDTQLWMTDGTEAGTLKITPVFADQNDPVNMAWNLFREVGGKLLFPAWYEDIGYELYAVVDAAAVGIEGYLVESTFKLYPNPASDVLTLAFLSGVGAVDVKIFNSLGQLVLHRMDFGAELMQIPIAHWHSGPYLLRVTSGGGSQTQTFIKF